MDDQQYLAYKDMLITVATLVDQDITVLESMKFKCDRIIKGREREQIKSAIQLWTSLEKREYLGLSNTHFLKELLHSCMRGHVEAVNIVENYERLQGAPRCFTSQQTPTTISSSKNPKIIYLQDPSRSGQYQELRTVFGQDLKREISYLTKTLGRNWTFFMQHLGLPQVEIEALTYDHRYMKDQIYQGFLLWQDMMKEHATKQTLIDALRAVNRNDLADTLEKGNY